MPLARALECAARLTSRAATLFLGAMMLVTVADVVLRWLARSPIFGTFDLVELFLVACIYLALPETFLRDEHVVVDLVDHLAGPRTVAALRLMGALLGLALLALMEYHMLAPARDAVAFSDATLDLEMPKIVHWSLILAGTGCSILTMGLVCVREAARLWQRRVS